MKSLNVVDLFAGVGGLSVGFSKAGFNISAAVEYDKQIAETYRVNHPGVKLYVEDIKKIAEDKNLKNYPADIIIGGPPCQGFSMAGARIRQGFIEDPRNNLFKEYYEIVRQLKPSFFLFENVKGILTMDKGRILNTILELFQDKDKLGGDKYYTYYRVFKASDFGIPQGRERVFIMGSLNNAVDFEKIIEQTKSDILKMYPHFFDKTTVWDAISNLENADLIGDIKGLIPNNQYQEFLESPTKKTSNHNKPTHDKQIVDRIKKISPGENYTKLDENIKSIHSGSYGRLEKNGIAPTITTRFDTPSGGRFIHPVENRTLSPREGARIQSFPDNFKFVGTKSSIYRQIGNAVPPKLAFFMAEVIKNAKKSIRLE